MKKFIIPMLGLLLSAPAMADDGILHDAQTQELSMLGWKSLGQLAKGWTANCTSTEMTYDGETINIHCDRSGILRKPTNTFIQEVKNDKLAKDKSNVKNILDVASYDVIYSFYYSYPNVQIASVTTTMIWNDGHTRMGLYDSDSKQWVQIQKRVWDSLVDNKDTTGLPIKWGNLSYYDWLDGIYNGGPLY